MNESVSLFNFGFCLHYNFIVKQIINYYRLTAHTCAFHIDSTTLADGTYELVPESESEQREAQVNLTEAAQNPNPISEEPRSSYAQEGKPRSMSYYFKFMHLLLFLSTCAFKFTGVDWNLSCMILGIYA